MIQQTDFSSPDFIDRSEKFHPIASVFPPMSEGEFQAHKEDIKLHGQIEPIWLYQNRIIDGRHRYRACVELNIEPKFSEYKGSSPISFVVSLNLKRRHLDASQQAVIVLKTLPEIEREAKERQRAGGGNKKNATVKAKSVIPMLGQAIDKGAAVKLAAKRHHISHGYLSYAKEIQEKAPELLEQIEAGTISIPKAVQEIRRKERIADLESIDTQTTKAISGVYDVIVVDPPWPMQKIERDAAPNQVLFDYPVMSLEQIKDLKIPATDDCHVFLWTTQKFLSDAFDVLKAWGLKYICVFVWHKSGGFQPFGLPQYNCEFVLYARKGTPEFINAKDFKTCFEAARTGHSKKPDEFYSLVRRVTAGRRLDMFNRRAIEGFDGWGLEAFDSNKDATATANNKEAA